MENKSHALAAGLFVVGIFALLVAMAAWLTRDTAEHRVFQISSREAVTGLQPQAGVRYKGVAVGKVTAIDLDSQSSGNVLVTIAVNDRAPITRSTFASLGFQGVTGLAFIQLDDAGESSVALETSVDSPARLPMRAGMVSRLSDQGARLLAELEQASQGAKLLLAADNQKRLMQAVDSLGQAATHVSVLAQRGEQLNLPQLVQDAGVAIKSMHTTSERLAGSAETVSASAAEFKRMSLRMNEPGGTLDKIARGSDALVSAGQALNTTVLPRLNRTADDAARTARQMGRAVDSVNDNPQSLLWGKHAPVAGPGESGFVEPGNP